MKNKPVIILAFANPRLDAGGYLGLLAEEADKISAQLKPYEVNDMLDLDRVENATVDSVFSAIEIWNKKKDICIFHYGGHADGGSLFLNTKDGAVIPASAKGLALLLGKIKSLQMVFLNACSTRPQVELLLEAGVPAVIATSEPVNDKVARNFSAKFYETLASGSNLGEAFDQARIFVQFKHGFEVAEPTQYRGLSWNKTTEEKSELPWSLYLNKGAEKVLQWRLPQEKTSRDALSIVDKYTCDRAEQNSRFKLNFIKNRRSQKFQFFLIHGEEKQSPQGLFERFVHEHIGSAYQRYFYKDVRLEEASELEEAKFNLLSCLFQALELNPNRYAPDELTVKTLASSRIAKEMDCIALKFRIYSSEWKDYTPSFIDWAVNQWCNSAQLSADMPDFVFFVSIVYDNEPSSKGGFFKKLFSQSPKEKILKSISGFTDVIALPELPPVIVSDVSKWLDRFTKDPETKQQYIDKFFSGTPADVEMNMSQVEKKLERIIEEFNG